MVNIFGSSDLERWMIVAFIIASLYFLWSSKENKYNARTRVLLTIPRIYLVVYYIFVIFDAYSVFSPVGDLVRAGVGSVYGVLFLFGVEAYVRRQNKKYGRC